MCKPKDTHVIFKLPIGCKGKPAWRDLAEKQPIHPFNNFFLKIQNQPREKMRGHSALSRSAQEYHWAKLYYSQAIPMQIYPGQNDISDFRSVSFGYVAHYQSLVLKACMCISSILACALNANFT